MTFLDFVVGYNGCIAGDGIITVPPAPLLAIKSYSLKFFSNKIPKTLAKNEMYLIMI